MVSRSISSRRDATAASADCGLPARAVSTPARRRLHGRLRRRPRGSRRRSPSWLRLRGGAVVDLRLSSRASASASRARPRAGAPSASARRGAGRVPGSSSHSSRPPRRRRPCAAARDHLAAGLGAHIDLAGGLGPAAHHARRCRRSRRSDFSATTETAVAAWVRLRARCSAVVARPGRARSRPSRSNTSR